MAAFFYNVPRTPMAPGGSFHSGRGKLRKAEAQSLRLPTATGLGEVCYDRGL